MFDSTLYDTNEPIKMLKITCEVCERELDEPGALLFSPPILDDKYHITPQATLCIKYHLCRHCYNKIMEIIQN